MASTLLAPPAVAEVADGAELPAHAPAARARARTRTRGSVEHGSPPVESKRYSALRWHDARFASCGAPGTSGRSGGQALGGWLPSSSAIRRRPRRAARGSRG